MSDRSAQASFCILHKEVHANSSLAEIAFHRYAIMSIYE